MERGIEPDVGALVYPRLTNEYLKTLIRSTTFSHVPVARTTVCTVMLHIDYAITESVICPGSEQYDINTGEKLAMNKVLGALREREYYVLRHMLHAEKLTKQGEDDGRRNKGHL